ncbi:uncharacterized protein LOC134206975 [Armigeres subalbatus]|uniref:uncharacterized protein LOC134206975 n=1 Tax=Armigeres subalbatus TaxID=124917 RepID=UPI002ED15E9D
MDILKEKLDPECFRKLEAHKIDDDTLTLLKEKDLSDIGIVELGPRLLIQSVIGKIKLAELYSNQPAVAPSTSKTVKGVEDNIEVKKPLYKLLEQDKKFRKVLYSKLDKGIVPEHKELLQMVRILCREMTGEMMISHKQPSFEAKQALAIELLDTFDFLECTKVCDEAPSYSLFFWKNGGKKKSEHTGLIQSHIRNSAKNIHPDDRKYNRNKPTNIVVNVPSETIRMAETIAQIEATAANFMSIAKCMADVNCLHQMLLNEKKSAPEIVAVLPHIKSYNGRMIQQAYERFNQKYDKDCDLKKVFGAGLLTEKNLFTLVADDHLRGCLRIMAALTRRGLKLNPSTQSTAIEEEMAAPLIRWTISLGEQVARYSAESAENGTIILPHIICSGGQYYLYFGGHLIGCGEISSHALDCFF